MKDDEIPELTFDACFAIELSCSQCGIRRRAPWMLRHLTDDHGLALYQSCILLNDILPKDGRIRFDRIMVNGVVRINLPVGEEV